MPKEHSVLITGSAGMLGGSLRESLSGDYEVYGIDIHSSRATSENFIECNITDKKAIAEVVSKVRPDVVIHTAAWTDVDGCELDPKKAYKVNFTGTENVALACRQTGAVLIYISTDFVFDGKKKTPYKETDLPKPLSVYAESKLKGEEAVGKLLKNYFILRTSWLYGKNGKNFVDTIVEKGRTEKMLKVVDDQVGSPTYAKDLAKAIHVLTDKICRAGLNLPYGIYHVSNSGAVSWYEYAREILKLAGLAVKVVPISSQALKRPAKRPAMSVLDNSKFTALTGHRMRDWEEALKEYLNVDKA